MRRCCGQWRLYPPQPQSSSFKGVTHNTAATCHSNPLKQELLTFLFLPCFFSRFSSSSPWQINIKLPGSSASFGPPRVFYFPGYPPYLVSVPLSATKINYGMGTTGEKKKRTSKKNVGGRSTSSHDNKKFRTRAMEKQRGMAFGFRKTATAVKKPDR